MAPEDLSTADALEVLAAQVAVQPRSLLRQLEIGFLTGTLGLLARLALDPVLGDHLPFSSFFPMLLAAGILGGLPAGAVCLLLTGLGGWFFFVPERMSWQLAPDKASQVPLYFVIGALMVGAAVVLRGALIRLEAHRRRHEMLSAELHHRLSRDLTVVTSIANSTLRAEPQPEQFRHAFMDRLAILRETHEALRAGDWQAVSLRSALERPLRLLVPDELRRIEFDGPEAVVDPDLAIGLSLCLWELAAQARRAGALSVPAGKVRVAWSVRHGRCDFGWLETGGPPRSSISAAVSPESLARHSGDRLHWRCDWLPGLVRWSVAFDAGLEAGAAAPPTELPPPRLRRRA